MNDPLARGQLSAERIVSAAVDLADRVGFDNVTIRRLADDLGTRPMTIYHYVPSKQDIVEGMVEQVFAEMALPPVDSPWTDALRVRCRSARAVLRRHPWAAPLMESRTSPGPISLAHHEAVLACLRRGGLSWQMTAHAYAVLDSFIFGFAFEEATLPATSGAAVTELATDVIATLDDQAYPTLTAFTTEHVLAPGYSFGASFDFGLDLIIDALARASRT